MHTEQPVITVKNSTLTLAPLVSVVSMDIFICLGAGFNAGGKDIVHSICRPKLVLAVALSLRLDSVIGYQKRTFTYYPRSSESMQQGV